MPDNHDNHDHDDYDQMVKKLQKEAMETLQKQIAEAEEAKKTANNKLQYEQSAFLVQLVRARHRKKMTQKELAERLGKQQSAVARIESGQGNPSLRTLLSIARVLNANLMVK